MLEQAIAKRNADRECGGTGAYVDSFAAYLAACGYAPTTIQSQLKLLGQFNEWLIRRRCSIHQLNDELVTTFLKRCTRRGRVHRGDPHTLRQFLIHLRTHGVLAPLVPVVDDSPLGQLQREYAQYLTAERGLAPVTVSGYVDVLRQFLTERFGNGPLDFGALTVSTITTFVLRHARTMSPRYAQGMVSALRSICRFLRQRGAIDRDLAAALPSVTDWRLATIPKYLNPEEVERVLLTCDRQTAVGRRDHAILLLLARLGLRAGEIITLELDDIGWRAGEILVRSSKRLPQDRLPLVAEVGAALATYLRRDRSPHRTRRVFLCMRAPRRGFGNPSSVSAIVRRALVRAGLSPALKGAHLFRHSLATRMLRHAASLPEIGMVLRHRSVQTTEIAAMLAAPDLSTWIGRRDRALLAVAIQTGLRVSELIGLRREHIVMGAGAHIRCDGKGRKQRCTPLGRDTAAVLDCWLRRDLPNETAYLFPSVRGRPLSRDAVEELVARYAHRAEQACPSMKQKRVSPHVLRHYLPFLTMSC